MAVAAVVALFAFGVVMTATLLPWWLVAIAVVVLAVVPAGLCSLAGRCPVVQVLFVVPLAALVPVVGLLAFDVLWASLGIPRPTPAIGLLVAGVVVAGVAYAYLRWLGEPEPKHPKTWALFACSAALALYAVTRQGAPPAVLVGTAACVGLATWIYLHWVAGPTINHPLWWALLLVVVTVIALPLIGEAVQGRRLNLALLIAGALIAGIVGLYALGLSRRPVPVERARRLVGAALLIGVAMPLLCFAFVRVAIGPRHEPHSEPVPVPGPTAPVPQVALDHRPLLLFDTDERLRTPLDVDRMLATGFVELCPEGAGLLAHCPTLTSAADLRNGVGNLRFETKRIEEADIPTTIYVHVVADRSHAGLLDLDYWWYLPDNPANTALGAMCGAGLVIPEITCFDHQSDWEGVTVVVRKDSGDPVAVHFAAHKHVVSVPWTALQAAAQRPPLRRYSRHRDIENHPLVFIARGTHAGYPLPCTDDFCESGTLFADNRHDGEHEWPERSCAGSCVTRFPTRAGSAAPASWNAFDGLWGSAICVAKVYCARSEAPRAPHQQMGRYERPWCYDYEAIKNLRRPRRVAELPPGCPSKKR